jgi:cellobiose transport system permease protein
MSEQLTTCLIAVAANLAVMLVIYSFMTLLLARLAWRGHGIIGIVIMIVVAQLIWIAPAFVIVGGRDPDDSVSLALWFGNWLVCGFSLPLLWRTVSRIPPNLGEFARLDGLTLFGTWRHVVFPFVKRDLVLLALFMIMAALLPFWAAINLPYDRVLLGRGPTPLERVGLLVGESLVGALPLVGTFFFAKRRQ